MGRMPVLAWDGRQGSSSSSSIYEQRAKCPTLIFHEYVSLVFVNQPGEQLPPENAHQCVQPDVPHGTFPGRLWHPPPSILRCGTPKNMLWKGFG